jgi:chemotaxis protein methyltransferase CheR
MSPREKYTPQLENLEIDLLLQAIDRLHGANLKEQGPAPIRRRIWEAIKREKARTVSGLQERLLHDPEALDRFLKTVLPPMHPLSIEFFRKFRYDLIPTLRTYPFVRIWQAGCGSVFETYCLAIILVEEGVYEKSLLYSTDVCEALIERGFDGLFSLEQLSKFENIYEKSGGRAAFENYFSGGGEHGVFDRRLRRNMVFSRHNLATDSSFNEFNAIFCRKPLQFYDRATQDRAHEIMFESLALFGILGLTSGETLQNCSMAPYYSELDREHNLYRKHSWPC